MEFTDVMTRSLARTSRERFRSLQTINEVHSTLKKGQAWSPSKMIEQQIRFCTTQDGAKIAYATNGQGYPLVKAGNWIGHLQFDLTGIWKHWIAEFSRYNLFIRYDQRGCGLSDRSIHNFTFEKCVEDLESVVDNLRLERFDLLGMSHGGAVSIAYAVRHPERVTRLILYGAFARGWNRVGWPAHKIEEMEAVMKLMRTGWGRDNPAFRQIFTSWFMPEATTEQMREFNEYQKVSTSPENAVQLARLISDTDVSSLLSQVSVPTFVFHARGDSVASFRNGIELASSIPGARFVPLESKNHILLENEPAWNEFLGECRNFLGVNERRTAENPSPQAVGTAQKAVIVGKIRNDPEMQEAIALLAGMSTLSVSRYRVVGNYCRYDEVTRNGLKDIRQKISSAFQSSALKRENYLFWAPPGSGKTFFVQQIAESLKKENVQYVELNLAQANELGLRSSLDEVQGMVDQPCLSLIDEIDSKPNESWPYEALLPYLDSAVSRRTRWVFTVAGSSGANLSEMTKKIISRPKGADLASRIPFENQYSIPPMSTGDRLLVAISQFIQTSKKMNRDVFEVEKLALFYKILNPNLSSARQLSEFATRCVERMHPSDDRIKYDNLFDPGDSENKVFWMRAQGIADELVNSFVAIQS